jgi:hypothetical protein
MQGNQFEWLQQQQQRDTTRNTDAIFNTIFVILLKISPNIPLPPHPPPPLPLYSLRQDSSLFRHSHAGRFLHYFLGTQFFVCAFHLVGRKWGSNKFFDETKWNLFYIFTGWSRKGYWRVTKRETEVDHANQFFRKGGEEEFLYFFLFLFVCCWHFARKKKRKKGRVKTVSWVVCLYVF